LIANTMMAAAHAHTHPVQGIAYLSERVGCPTELEPAPPHALRTRQH